MADTAREVGGRTTTENARKTVEAVNEAARTNADASRRTAEEGLKAGRQIFDAWLSSTEAALKATFELQNVAINTGLSLFETVGNGNRGAYQQWVDVVRQSQQVALEAWQAGKRATEQVVESINSANK